MPQVDRTFLHPAHPMLGDSLGQGIDRNQSRRMGQRILVRELVIARHKLEPAIKDLSLSTHGNTLTYVFLQQGSNMRLVEPAHHDHAGTVGHLCLGNLQLCPAHHGYRNCLQSAKQGGRDTCCEPMDRQWIAAVVVFARKVEQGVA